MIVYFIETLRTSVVHVLHMKVSVLFWAHEEVNPLIVLEKLIRLKGLLHERFTLERCKCMVYSN